MFCVSEAQAAVIRTAFEQRGELSAVVELRRLFPGLGNIAWARECVRTIAGWQPLRPICQRRGCSHRRDRRQSYHNVRSVVARLAGGAARYRVG